MAMAVVCSGCGKSLNVKDELVGKSIRCPACKETFVAKAATAAPSAWSAGASKGKVAAKKDQAVPKLHLSPGMIAFVAALIIIPLILIFWNFGPGAVRAEIAARESKIDDDIRDVVEWVLRVKSENSFRGFSRVGGLRTAPPAPRVHSVAILWSPLYMSMPEKVGFAGTSSEGLFQGFYYPKTGEVEAELDFGGTVLPSGVLMKRGNEQFKVTGRVKEGAGLTAEIEGKPAVLKPPTTQPEPE